MCCGRRGRRGLAAAHRLGASGLRVMLTEQDVVLGGGCCSMRAGLPGARACARACPSGHGAVSAPHHVLGAYGHGVFGALETLSPAEAPVSVACASGCGSSVRGAWYSPLCARALIAFPGTIFPA